MHKEDAMQLNDALRDKLITYIENAWSMENQIVETLEKQVKDTAKFPDIQTQVQRHLDETMQHRDRMALCLAAYDKKPSSMKGALTHLLGTLAGTVGGARSDSLAMTARDDYMVEHFEIGSYELLIAAARAFGDQQTVDACEANLRDEVRMANWLETHMGHVAVLSLREEGIDLPQVEAELAETSVFTALRSAHAMLPGSELDQPIPPASPTI